MEHPVTVERMVALQRRMQRVLGVAQVDAVEIVGDLAVNGGEVVGVPLGSLRSPWSGAVGMIVLLGKGGQELADDLWMGGKAHWGLPMTKLTVVAVLPPKLSVANVFAPST